MQHEGAGPGLVRTRDHWEEGSGKRPVKTAGRSWPMKGVWQVATVVVVAAAAAAAGRLYWQSYCWPKTGFVWTIGNKW